MITPRMGFVIYGVHKDGLKDPMGNLFIDEKVIAQSKKALNDRGVELVEYPIVVATKEEARLALKTMKDDEKIDGVILFSGTWVWASNMIAAIRDYGMTGKGICIWTHPGSQGWRPVGGLVLHGALLEVGIPHKFVYGLADEAHEIDRIVHFSQACHLKNRLNQATIGAFGGRGMGQTVGVADPSQWMRVFGLDIDSRDTTELIRTAEEVTPDQLKKLEPRIIKLFGKLPESSVVNERSLRLYLAIKTLVEKEKWEFYTIQSFPGLGDDYSATCFTQSMMLEDRVGTSTLGDFNTALTVYLMTRLSAEPVYYGDLQHIDKKHREIKIIGDGAIPPSLAGKVGPAGFSVHGIPTEGQAGGLSIRAVAKVGKGILARLGRVNGEFQMVIVPVSIFEPSQETIMSRLDECGIPFWPHGFVTVEGDIDCLLENWMNEYACLGYGEELYPVMVEFCKLTGITVVLP